MLAAEYCRIWVKSRRSDGLSGWPARSRERAALRRALLQESPLFPSKPSSEIAELSLVLKCSSDFGLQLFIGTARGEGEVVFTSSTLFLFA